MQILVGAPATPTTALELMEQCAVTVAIPTYRRSKQLLFTLAKILACDPAPAEIILHIDHGDRDTEQLIRLQYPQVKILTSTQRLGPGGGRNKIIQAAQHEIVASFDDDSYPLDQDYFQRLLNLFGQLSRVAVLGAGIFHLGEAIQPAGCQIINNPNFVGCGCSYRREAFLQTTGYVPLPLAYGMEEVDLALRLLELDWEIVASSELRVMHHTTLEHHQEPQITAASIANQLLLTYLRYPFALWGLGIFQTWKRVVWLLQQGRWSGIGAGLTQSPRLIGRHHRDRQPVSARTMQKYLQLRRQQPDLTQEAISKRPLPPQVGNLA